MEKDIHWQGIIDHAIDGGGYTGVEYTKKEQRVDDQSAIEDVISGIKATSLDDEESDEFEEYSKIIEETINDALDTYSNDSSRN